MVRRYADDDRMTQGRAHVLTGRIPNGSAPPLFNEAVPAICACVSPLSFSSRMGPYLASSRAPAASLFTRSRRLWARAMSRVTSSTVSVDLQSNTNSFVPPVRCSFMFYRSTIVNVWVRQGCVCVCGCLYARTRVMKERRGIRHEKAVKRFTSRKKENGHNIDRQEKHTRWE